MIAEIPSVAFERIDIYNNTSIIQDEVLAQRLGLVPLKIDPDWMEWFDANSPDVVDKDTGEVESKYNSANTVQFTLHVKCERNPNAPKDSTDPNELYINSNVYAKDLKYVPFGQQEEYMKPAPSAVYPDILLAKLRPGQEIELVAYAQLGIGSDHAKFSPVATASYRLLPRIDIIGAPISGQQAKRFQKHFPSGVIGIDNKGEAYVADARKDTVSREILRHEEFQGRVKLGRQRDHFIFNVETTGAMQPDEIFVKSINHLRNKAIELLSYNLGSE